MLRSKLPDVELPLGISLWDFIQDLEEKFLDRTFLVENETGKEYTYREMLHYVKNIRSALYNLGMRKGDFLAFLAPNKIDTVLAMFAVWSLGGITMYRSHDFDIGQMDELVSDYNPKFILTTDARMAEVESIIKGRPITLLSYGNHEASIAFSELRDYDGDRAPQVAIDPQKDTAIMAFTSGTTGEPKPIPMTHYGLIGSNRQISQAITYQEDVTGGEVIVFYVIVSGSWAVNVLLQCLNQAQTFILLRKFDVDEHLSAVEKYKGTKIYLSPIHANEIARSKQTACYDVSSVVNVMCGMSVLHKQTANDLWNVFVNARYIRSGFGMMETHGATIIPLAETKKTVSVGDLLPNVEVKVIDINDGRLCGPYKDGKMMMRTPFLMKGYYKMEAETRAAIDEDGWFNTGDIAYFDDDGHLYLRCRHCDLLNINGKMFTPTFIEDICNGNPSITSSAVAGALKKDGSDNHIPYAFVVLSPQSTLNRRDIETFINDRMPEEFSEHVNVEIVPEIPLNSNYKPSKLLLLANLFKRLGDGQ